MGYLHSGNGSVRVEIPDLTGDGTRSGYDAPSSTTARGDYQGEQNDYRDKPPPSYGHVESPPFQTSTVSPCGGGWTPTEPAPPPHPVRVVAIMSPMSARYWCVTGASSLWRLLRGLQEFLDLGLQPG